MARRISYRGKAAVLALAVGVGILPAALAAPKPVSVKWKGGEVLVDGGISFKTRPGKTLLTFTKNVRATAPGLELQHADKATAEVDAKWQFDTITANGGVRFAVNRGAGSQTSKATGRCAQAVIYNTGDKKPTADQRLLVADLTGDVYLTLTQPAPAGATAPAEPITLEGARAKIWLTADGYEGTVSGGAD